MSDLATRRQINRGYSDGFTRALEVVLTPLILGATGALVDGWLGTRPGFTIGLATAGVIGIFTKMWLGYDREMRRLEENAPWKGRTVPVTGLVTAARTLRPVVTGTGTGTGAAGAVTAVADPGPAAADPGPAVADDASPPGGPS